MAYLKSLIPAILLALTLNSQTVFSQDTKVYNFLNLDADARSSSLAGSVVTSEGDVNSIFYNPAGLSTIDEQRASVGFFKYLLDINAGNAAYSMKYKDIGYFGVGIRYMNYGSFQKSDENFNDLGTFSANDLALSLGYSNFFIPNFSYGVNLKLIYSSIDEYTSTAVATDFGLLYMMPEQTLNFGLSLLNLGTQLSEYSNTKEDLPLNLKIGVSKQLDYLPLTVNVSLNNLTEETDNFGDRFKNFTVGGDFKVSQFVNLRLGYNNRQRQDLKTGSTIGIGGFSAGIGIKFFEKYVFDYGFNSLGKIGSTHRINLGIAIK